MNSRDGLQSFDFCGYDPHKYDSGFWKITTSVEKCERVCRVLWYDCGLMKALTPASEAGLLLVLMTYLA